MESAYAMDTGWISIRNCSRGQVKAPRLLFMSKAQLRQPKPIPVQLMDLALYGLAMRSPLCPYVWQCSDQPPLPTVERLFCMDHGIHPVSSTETQSEAESQPERECGPLSSCTTILAIDGIRDPPTSRQVSQATVACLRVSIKFPILSRQPNGC